MKASTRPLLFLIAFLGGASPIWAQPFGYAVNSRGFAEEDRMHLLWRVDLATGQAEAIGATGFLDMEGLAFDAGQVLFGADDESNTLVTVSVNSGSATPVANERSNMGIPVSQSMDFGMAFTCDGTLLVVSDYQRSLFSADPATGRLSRIGAEGSLGAPITALAARGHEVFGLGQGIDAAGNADSPNLYRIDVATGSAERIGALGSQVAPYANAGLAFDGQGSLWAVTDRRDDGAPDLPSEILRIDTHTGNAEKVADASVIGFESLAIAPPGGCQDQGQGEGAGDPGAMMIPVNHPFGLGVLVASLLLLAGATLRGRQV